MQPWVNVLMYECACVRVCMCACMVCMVVCICGVCLFDRGCMYDCISDCVCVFLYACVYVRLPSAMCA